MRRAIVALMVAALAALAVACGRAGSENADSTKVDRQQQIYAGVQPVPMYDYSNTRQALIEIYNQKTTAVATYSYVLALDGHVVFSCASRGYPIEGGSELTNPLQVAGWAQSANSGSSGNVAIGQADPDGIFHPSGSQGTYIICVRPNGDTVAVYAEPTVITLPFAAKVVNGVLTDDGTAPSTARVNLGRTAKVVTPVATP